MRLPIGPRPLAAGLTCLLLVSFTGHAAPAAFPPELDAYLTRYAKLEPAERAHLLAGDPVSKLLDSDPSKEVAVFGAVWIDAPVGRYLAAVKDIERFESGEAFRVTKKVSTPPRLDDFARLTVPDDDANDLKSCKVSECQLKLSADAIERFRREIDWTRPDAHERLNHLARELAFQFVTKYLEGGNDELAVYRDAAHPTLVAQELASMIDRVPLGEFLPQVRRYLLEFPKATLPNSESFIYWQEANFGLKPTIRINHLVMAEDPSGAIVASKMLYASHYFWTALELRVLVRDPARGKGFWFVTESRSRSDGLSGFVGRFVRSKARGEAAKGTVSVLKVTRDNLEGR